jgi:hypothetical protein
MAAMDIDYELLEVPEGTTYVNPMLDADYEFPKSTSSKNLEIIKNTAVIYENTSQFSMTGGINPIEFMSLKFPKAANIYVYMFFREFSNIAMDVADVLLEIPQIMKYICSTKKPPHAYINDKTEGIYNYINRYNRMTELEKLRYKKNRGEMVDQMISDKINYWVMYHRAHNTGLEETVKNNMHITRMNIIQFEEQICHNIYYLLDKQYFIKYIILYCKYHIGDGTNKVIIDEPDLLNTLEGVFDARLEWFKNNQKQIISDVYWLKYTPNREIKTYLIETYPMKLGAHKGNIIPQITGIRMEATRDPKTGILLPGLLGETLMELREFMVRYLYQTNNKIIKLMDINYIPSDELDENNVNYFGNPAVARIR